MKICAVGLIAVGVALASGLVVLDEARADPAPHPSASAPVVAGYSVEVMVVHATRAREPRAKPEIDPRIGDLPELRQDPFSLYDKFELLQKERLPLKQADRRSLTLPNGQILYTELLEILAQETFRISTGITKPGGKEFLAKVEVKARRDKPFIVAGQSHKNGILVLVLRVVK
ncbi:MAG: hypothetical protein JW751_25640 [Polyangiaceae bacterium]|nr:hypothetical protein [Polyangiaceae bacterium]